MMSTFFFILSFVSLIYFVILWRKKKLAKMSGNNEDYLKISKKKRIVGVVCVASFIAFVGLAPAPASKTHSGQNSNLQQKMEEKTPEKTLQQKAMEDKSVSQDYHNALIRGIRYANRLHMSKQAVYDQLVSQYGDKFSPEAAQWAVSQMSDINWKQQALEKAKTYQKRMNMSTDAIYDQLTSEYGEKFTKEEAEYAIQNLGK
ncbi:Ltp family lipoprotein [Acidaminococcus massiliensis]|uniref:Ltp family lipoprotein n=1 Tax=Acidaminococcus massiliensis TaxID=1852375 RepID=UPI00351FD631